MKLPEFYPKGWGYEQWIVNNDKYCGKLLRFVNGKSCSWHYHKLKHETFYIQEGTLDVTFGVSDDIEAASFKRLQRGDVFEVPPQLRHTMRATNGDCVMFEFSTTHFEEDSYRIIKGNQVEHILEAPKL